MWAAQFSHPDCFFIGGEWVSASSDQRFNLVNPASEETLLQVAEARQDDLAKAVAAARRAFDKGPWRWMTHAIANDTPFGLNASIFTNDVDRAYHAARRLRAGKVGHNEMRGDFTIAFGGFKQSGIGRESGFEGLSPLWKRRLLSLKN